MTMMPITQRRTLLRVHVLLFQIWAVSTGEIAIYGTLALGDSHDLISLEESEINFKGSHLFSVHSTMPVE